MKNCENIRIHYKSMHEIVVFLSQILIRTGVSMITPQTNGAMKPNMLPAVFVMDIRVPAKAGLRSMWLIWQPQAVPTLNPVAIVRISTKMTVSLVFTRHMARSAKPGMNIPTVLLILRTRLTETPLRSEKSESQAIGNIRSQLAMQGRVETRPLCPSILDDYFIFILNFPELLNYSLAICLLIGFV